MEIACETCVHKDKSSFSATCVECGIAMMNYEHMPFTNADRIRAMTDEELAWYLYSESERMLRVEGWLDWLRQEVDNGKSEPAT